MMIRKIFAFFFFLTLASLSCPRAQDSGPSTKVVDLPGDWGGHSVVLETKTDQVSFASFAYFIDRLKFPFDKLGQVWATPRSVYEGPFHTNDQLHIYLPPRYLEEGHVPFFRGPVTTAAAALEYYNGYGPMEKSGRVNSKYFGMIFQDEVKTGVARIPLPAHPEEEVKVAAMGGSELIHVSGVWVPHDAQNRLTGGIVVNGSLDSLTFSSERGKNFEIVFANKKKAATIEVDFAAKKTVLLSSDGKQDIYEGIPNGAIYVAGDVGYAADLGISGRVRGKWTVACGADLYIAGNLLYSDTPEGNRPAGNDTLGLIARNVFVTRKAPDLLFLYATVFVARKEENGMVGTFFVFSSDDLPHEGQLIWWGNYIGEFPAIMGRFDRGTGESHDGYDLHKFYDSRLAKDPPPFFPKLQKTEVGIR